MSNIVRLEITETVGKANHRFYKYEFSGRNFNLVLCDAFIPTNILEGENGIWCDDDEHLKMICLDGEITISSYREYNTYIKLSIDYDKIKEAFREIQNYQSMLPK